MASIPDDGWRCDPRLDAPLPEPVQQELRKAIWNIPKPAQRGGLLPAASPTGAKAVDYGIQPLATWPNADGFWGGSQRVRPWNCDVAFPVPIAHFYRYTSVLNPSGLTLPGRKYLADVAHDVLPTLREHTGRIAVRLSFHEPLRTQPHRAGDPPLRRNLRLYSDPCLVALRLAGLWCDDAQIDKFEARRCAPEGDGRVDVTILALPEHWNV